MLEGPEEEEKLFESELFFGSLALNVGRLLSVILLMFP